MRVDPEVLHEAAGATRRLMDGLPQDRLANMHCDPEAVGDAEFAGTMTDFCTRWRTGLKYMFADAEAMAGHLDGSAQRYEDDDNSFKRLFDDVKSWF
jgi:hypothetical protein